MTRNELLDAVTAAILARFSGGPTGPDETARAVAREHAETALSAICAAGFNITRKVGDFRVGDTVEKHTGDYGMYGEVRAAFTTQDDGPVRYVVAHDCKGFGGFGRLLHIYSPANLRRWKP